MEEVQKVPDVTPKETVYVAETAPPAVKKAVAALDSLDPDEQEKAVLSLAQMNHPSAQDALIAALQHPSKNVRITAAFKAAEARVKDPTILTVLLEAAGDEKWGKWELSKRSFRDTAIYIGSSGVPT